MVRAFLNGPLLGLLIVFSVMSPAIASGRSERLNPCTVRIIGEDSNGRAVDSSSRIVISNRDSISLSTSSLSRVSRIEQTCVVNTRTTRVETPTCGFNQYSQPRVGEFKQSEWRRNGRVVYSETELVRCF
ncbi:MAG: hypothetical protein MJA27_05765 [Pseudanabaenales cyanobacterium]|nr:hypothetical protein [Pseudanabaenales cyanobacterium]